MRFEWDQEKAKKNLKRHGVSFDEAVTLFYDFLSATFDDPNHSFDEPRLITVGFSSKGKLLFVSHTEREKAIRLISARIATARERKHHESQTK